MAAKASSEEIANISAIADMSILNKTTNQAFDSLKAQKDQLTGLTKELCKEHSEMALEKPGFENFDDRMQVDEKRTIVLRSTKSFYIEAIKIMADNPSQQGVSHDEERIKGADKFVNMIVRKVARLAILSGETEEDETGEDPVDILEFIEERKAAFQPTKKAPQDTNQGQGQDQRVTRSQSSATALSVPTITIPATATPGRPDRQSTPNRNPLTIEEISPPQPSGEASKEGDQERAQSSTETANPMVDPELTRQLEDLKRQLRKREEEVKGMQEDLKQKEKEREEKEERKKQEEVQRKEREAESKRQKEKKQKSELEKQQKKKLEEKEEAEKSTKEQIRQVTEALKLSKSKEDKIKRRAAQLAELLAEGSERATPQATKTAIDLAREDCEAEEGDDEQEPFTLVKKKNKAKKQNKKVTGEADSESSSDDEEERTRKEKQGARAKTSKQERKKKATTDIESEGESSDEEIEQKTRKSATQLRREQIALNKASDRRPQEALRLDKASYLEYLAYKRTFMKMTDVDGLDEEDILNELAHWFKGIAKTYIDIHRASENPKKALKKVWKKLDQHYAQNAESATEKLEKIIKEGPLSGEDAEGYNILAAKLETAYEEVKAAGLEKEFDAFHIIKRIVKEKIPHSADKFFEQDVARKIADKAFATKFRHLVSLINMRAQVLTAKGKVFEKNSTKQTAKLAATTTQPSYSERLRNSPKQQQRQLPQKKTCLVCKYQHSTTECNVLSNLPMSLREQELRKNGLCFHCFQHGHLARNCPEAKPECGICGGKHQSLFHGRGPSQPTQNQQRQNNTRPNQSNQAQRPNLSNITPIGAFNTGSATFVPGAQTHSL